MSLPDIWQRLEARYDGFSPQLQRAARFVREHPQDVALNSMRTLSSRAGVSPAAMSRLTQALDIENWEAFQAEHRDWLTTERQGVFSNRAGRLLDSMKLLQGEDVLLDAIRDAEMANVETAFAPQTRRMIDKAAALLIEAPSITVFGIRSCFPVAFSIHYSLSLFSTGARLATGTGGALLDELDHLRPGDAIIIVSVDPYSREAVEAARRAQEAGARIVALTDGPLSPIALLAEVALVAGNAGPAYIASPIGLLALAQGLTTLLFARGGDDALAALRRRESALATRSAYLPSGKQT
ncbi:MurR/RpiR family transcriptional regulator [Aliihoeflea sp. PC F10.4]